jgi:transcriptional regulator with XRE-family HTH domain
MEITINTASDLGLVVRSVRRSSNVRLDDLAATAQVSKQFASDVEHGKPTVQLGLVLKLLSELGVVCKVDIPQEALPELTVLRLKGVRPYRKRSATELRSKRLTKNSKAKGG